MTCQYKHIFFSLNCGNDRNNEAEEKRDLVAGARLGLHAKWRTNPGPCPGAHHTMISASREWKEHVCWDSYYHCLGLGFNACCIGFGWGKCLEEAVFKFMISLWGNKDLYLQIMHFLGSAFCGIAHPSKPMGSLFWLGGKGKGSWHIGCFRLQLDILLSGHVSPLFIF